MNVKTMLTCHLCVQVLVGAGVAAAWVPAGLGGAAVHQRLLLVHPAESTSGGGEPRVVEQAGEGEGLAGPLVALFYEWEVIG